MQSHQKSFTVSIAAMGLVLACASAASAAIDTVQVSAVGGSAGKSATQRSGVSGGIEGQSMPMSSSRKAKPKLSFRAIDTNRDGEITPEELTAASKIYPQLSAKNGLIKFYSSIDGNQDGAINKQEFQVWLSTQTKGAPTAKVGG